MKSKRSILIVGVSFVSVALVTCFSFFSGHKDDTKNPSDYISFASSYTAYDETNDNEAYARMAVYEYDFLSGETAQIFDYPLTAMSGVAAYDKKANTVYYVKEKNNDTYLRQNTGGDQIYAHNLETDSDTMLTEELFAVNYVVPVDGALFLSPQVRPFGTTHI